MICDIGCFVGAWPFRSLPVSNMTGLKEMARRFHVKRVALSSIEEVFWEDGFEATRSLARRIAGERWISQFQVINPSFPSWRKDLERGVRELGIRGIRLIPSYHHYSLNAPFVKEAVAAAREYDLPVAVYARLQDERMHWMAQFPPTPPRDVATFLEKAPRARIAIQGCELSEIKVFAAAAKRRPNTWVDWSRMRAMLYGIDRLLETIPAARVLYGSLWPLQTPSAMLNLLTIARVKESTKSALAWGNAQRFIDG